MEGKDRGREKLKDLVEKHFVVGLDQPAWSHQPLPALPDRAGFTTRVFSSVSAGGDSSSHSQQTNPGGLGSHCLVEIFSWKPIFSEEECVQAPWRISADCCSRPPLPSLQHDGLLSGRSSPVWQELPPGLYVIFLSMLWGQTLPFPHGSPSFPVV